MLHHQVHFIASSMASSFGESLAEGELQKQEALAKLWLFLTKANPPGPKALSASLTSLTGSSLNTLIYDLPPSPSRGLPAFRRIPVDPLKDTSLKA